MLTLTTKNKKINLVLRTRKIVNIANILKGKNFEDVYFKAMSELNLDALSKIIFAFAEYEDEKETFNSSDNVYDFIDDYKSENNKSYIDIFKEIAEAINKEGFFNTTMTAKELKDKISNPLSQINLEDIAKTSVEKAIANIAEKEIATQV